MRAFQSIHDRAFDLGQVERDASEMQIAVDRLEAFECAGIDMIDGRAHEHDVLEVGFVGDQRANAILEKTCIGKIEALVDP